jgi:hypothetical protein
VINTPVAEIEFPYLLTTKKQDPKSEKTTCGAVIEAKKPFSFRVREFGFLYYSSRGEKNKPTYYKLRRDLSKTWAIMVNSLIVTEGKKWEQYKYKIKKQKKVDFAKEILNIFPDFKKRIMHNATYNLKQIFIKTGYSPKPEFVQGNFDTLGRFADFDIFEKRNKSGPKRIKTSLKNINTELDFFKRAVEKQTSV